MPPLTLLVKPVSGLCNLACGYCFGLDLFSRRGTAQAGVMDASLVDALLSRAFAYAEGACTFVFQGGEPCLAGLGFYQDFVALARSRRPPGLELGFMLQTNGVLIDDAWARFLAQEGFLTGLSIDGPRILHDKNRQFPDGSGSHGLVMDSARRLKEAKADFNVLCVVDSGIADNPLLVWDFFRRKGLDWIQYIPCLEPFGAGRPGSAGAPSPGALASFLKYSFEAWRHDLDEGRRVSVRYFDDLLAMAMGSAPASCGMAGRCSAYITVDADGAVYPCDFYTLEEWRLGNVLEDGLGPMLASATARRFAALSEEGEARCRTCGVYGLCRGGCRRDRELALGGGLGLNRYCETWRDFLAWARPRLAGMASSPCLAGPQTLSS